MEQNQEPEKQRLLNAYNTYTRTRASANLARLVGKLALQFGERIAIWAVLSPVGWIAVGIGIVVVGTFLIVFSAGTPSFPAEETPTPEAIRETLSTPTISSPTPTSEPHSGESP